MMVRPRIVAPPPTALADRRILFCVGAQRTGSGWLHAMFRHNPGVHVPVLKEVHYWDTIRPPHQQFYRRRAQPDLDWYRQASLLSRLLKYHRAPLFDGGAVERLLEHRTAALGGDGISHEAYARLLLDGAGNEQVIVDNTPCYALLGRDTYSEMAKLGRDVRFLFVMRDPVTRLWSGIQHRGKYQIARKALKPSDLPALLLKELSRKYSRDVARSNYERTIKALEAAVDPSRICYAFYETLLTQPEFDRVCDALELPRQRIRTWRRVNRSSRSDVKLDAATRQATLQRLAPVYGFVRQRFGETVPGEWLA